MKVRISIASLGRNDIVITRTVAEGEPVMKTVIAAIVEHGIDQIPVTIAVTKVSDVES